VVIDEAADGVFQLDRAAVDAAPDLFFGQLSEPALDPIEPGSRGGSEVQVEARTFGKPAADPLAIFVSVARTMKVALLVVYPIPFDQLDRAQNMFVGSVSLQV